MSVELPEEERQEAIAYVDAVVMRAEGTTVTATAQRATGPADRPLVVRLVPGVFKRAFVRTLIYVLRHPFDHLAHPLEIRLEAQIAEARAVARSALRRAEKNAIELERLRRELDRRARQPRA